ncbi:1-acyl-sn-glycerol-3-phosphate acyltransferase [Synechocystis sp. LKSZ1]|uniref:1-acyl-sn-glycerol-3-phosphate acyltransferase n=1 Tax=Synechocystis sp. LKSZ1 TaxID=3144951 RepID=UPI00336C2D04
MSTSAQPALAFIPPQLSPWVLKSTQLLLPWWLRWRTPLVEIIGTNLETLVTAYQRFQSGQVRLILAFRHPSVNDPFCLGYLCWQLLPQAARDLKISLKSPTHAHFIYDRGIPLWAGSLVGWLYSRLGGTPIQRGKLDLPGLRSARQLLTDGAHPLAAAPEGATNGHNEIISPLEPGIAQLGFWAVEDLHKAQRSEQVLIIPVGIQYFYLKAPWPEIEALLSNLEKDCGLIPDPSHSLDEGQLYQRLYRLGDVILGEMETFYRRFYHQELPDRATLEKNLAENLVTVQNQENQLLGLRLQNLLQVALKVAEQYFKLTPKGSLPDRCRRLEQAGWDYIYREELKNGQTLPAMQQGLADIVAEEANLRLWHMRLVETFVAVTGYYVKEKPTVERFADTLLLLWDVVARIKGNNSFFRPALGKQRAQLTIAKPISVTERFPAYQENRRQAVAALTQDLEATLSQLIL